MEENTFLANIQREGLIQPSEKDEEEKETPSESPAEKELAEDEPESQTGEDKPKGEGDEKKPEGKLKEGEESVVFQAFHKHPRFKALTDELGELRNFRDEVTPLLPLIKKLGEPGIIDEKTEIPNWFSKMFGEDDNAWKEYQRYSAEEKKELENRILNSIQEQQKQSSQQVKKQEEWLDGEIEKLDERIAEEKLPKYEKNELLKVAIDYKPTDEKGNISIGKAYDILQLLKKKEDKPKSNEKKELADKTMAKSKGDREEKNYKTSWDLQGKSFHDLIPE